MISGHGGNIFALADELGCPPGQILDMSSNINPLGTMPEIVDLLGRELQSVQSLPEVDNRAIIRAFSTCYDVDADRLLAGSGTTQFIYTLPKALKTRKALILAPTYSDYADGCRLHGAVADYFITRHDQAFTPDLAALSRAIEDYDTVYICNPNNPTGCLIPGRNLLELCRNHPGTNFIIDESYLPFALDGQDHSLLHSDLPNLTVMHSLSKIFGIPGMRIGFIKSDTTTIRALEPHLPPWSVNALAQVAAGFLLSHTDLTDGFVRQTRDYLASEGRLLTQRMSNCRGLRSYPSTASFFLFSLPDPLKAPALCRFLSSRRILIRDCSNFAGLTDRFFRIALKSPEANRLVCQKIAQWMDQEGNLPGGDSC